MAKSAPRTRRSPSEPWKPTEEDAEATIYRVFKIELRDVLGRLARSLTDFVELVEATFPHHTLLPCRISYFDNPTARAAAARIRSLTDDARNLLLTSVDSYGIGEPTFREPLTCKRVRRPIGPEHSPIPRRSVHAAEMLGWLTPNEAKLGNMLRVHCPEMLEDRQHVASKQSGLVVGKDANGNELVGTDPGLAWSDRSIAAFYPLLVKDELRDYELAVADSKLEDLKSRARNLLAWKPQLVRNRSLDPNWRENTHSIVKVIRTELRHEQQADGNGSIKLAKSPTSVGSSDAAEPPWSNSKPHKPAGWTKKELVDEVGENETSFSPATFDRIREAAGLKAAAKGGQGQFRRYSKADLRKLIAAVEAGTRRNKVGIAAAWRTLLNE